MGTIEAGQSPLAPQQVRRSSRQCSYACDDGRVPLFTAIVAVVIVINLLALENAPKLTPHRLGLLPTNPYPWTPVKVAEH